MWKRAIAEMPWWRKGGSGSGITEMPWWRMGGIRPGTSQMLKQLEKSRPAEPVPYYAQQSKLLRFVDTTGLITNRPFAVKPEPVNLKEYVQSSFPRSLEKQHRDEALQLYDAVEYVQREGFSMNLDGIMGIHKRVLGSESSNLRAGVDEKDVVQLLDGIKAPGGASQCFASAAQFLASFRALRPFDDGNARVGEVIAAKLLKDWTVFPQRVHVVPLFENMKHRRLFQGEIATIDDESKLPLPDLAAYMVEMSWLSSTSKGPV